MRVRPGGKRKVVNIQRSSAPSSSVVHLNYQEMAIGNGQGKMLGDLHG